MPNLFSKDEDFLKSPPIIGYEILTRIREAKGERMSIFDLAKDLRKSKKLSARSLYYGMLFLYSLDILEFDEPYLVCKEQGLNQAEIPHRAETQ